VRPMKEIRFGTDGWRAPIADSFTFENVRRVADAYAAWLKQQETANKNMAVGFDTRFLSDRFAEAFAQQLEGNGVNALLSDRFLPTPALSLYVARNKLAGGVMFTASHNPYFYNGIKFKGEYGGPMLPRWTHRIETLLAAKVKAANRDDPALLAVDMLTPWLNSLKAYTGAEKLKALKGKTIVFDAMHGAGCAVAEQLEELTGLNVLKLRDHPDPMFGGVNPEPLMPALQPLADAVVQNKALCGFATDGDADRFGVIDEKGAFIELHDLLPLLFEHLVKNRGGKGRIVRTSSMADTVDKMAAEHKTEVCEVAVGFKNITEEMLKGDVLIGGEESGGFGFAGHIPERDGVLSCLLFLELLAERNVPPSRLVDELRERFGPFHYRRIDAYGKPDALRSNLQNLLRQPPDAIAGRKVERIVSKDGIKFYLEDAWMLIRLSDTEPLFRVYCGGGDEAIVKKLLAAGREMMQG